MIFTSVLFVALAVNGLGFVVYAIRDITQWFQQATWGAIGVALLVGFPVLALFLLPASLTFFAAFLFPAVNKSTMGPWSKLFSNLGLLVGAFIVTGWIRFFVLGIFGVA